MLENSVEEEEQRILDTYEPAPFQESDSDSDDVPSISHLRALKTYVSSVFKIPMTGEQLKALLYREKQDIEVLQGKAGRAQLQPTIIGSFKPSSEIS